MVQAALELMILSLQHPELGLHVLHQRILTESQTLGLLGTQDSRAEACQGEAKEEGFDLRDGCYCPWPEGRTLSPLHTEVRRW